MKKSVDGKIVGYHTQENRYEILLEPILCKDNEAWLGYGYYFWTDLKFARYWGEDWKRGVRNAGTYDIYRANINVEDYLDTAFSIDGYITFKGIIEKTIKLFENRGVNVNLSEINKFLSEKGYWKSIGVKGIIYADTPYNVSKKNRIFSKIEPLYYEKRIQLVAFDKITIEGFEIFKEDL